MPVKLTHTFTHEPFYLCQFMYQVTVVDMVSTGLYNIRQGVYSQVHLQTGCVQSGTTLDRVCTVRYICRQGVYQGTTAVVGNTSLQALASSFCQKSALAIAFYPDTPVAETHCLTKSEIHSFRLNGWTDAVCPFMHFLKIAKDLTSFEAKGRPIDDFKRLLGGTIFFVLYLA